MIIIAFSTQSTKLLPRLICHCYRHCAPVIKVSKNHYIMYQFVRPGEIVPIHLKLRQLHTLGAYGWRFITLPKIKPQVSFCGYTCVYFTKYVVGITAPFIQTPDGLYKYLTTKLAKGQKL